MEHDLIYGPVPSRRLGLSLGVDLVPYKKCPFDCIYCQIGRTPQTTMERKAYISPRDVMNALNQRISSGIQADHITLGGSGEPTLNSEIGTVIREIKAVTDIPVAVLTNGALLGEQSVQNALKAADVILPSLDAPDASVFAKINRPHPAISFASLVEGMVDFRKEYTGQIWLEIFFIEGVNTRPDHIEGFRKQIERIRPDRVHLNTAVRPTAEPSALQATEARLQEIANQLGEKAEVIAEYSDMHKDADRRIGVNGDLEEAVLQMITRRPCTLADVAFGLDASRSEIQKHLDNLVRKEAIQIRKNAGKTYYTDKYEK